MTQARHTVIGAIAAGIMIIGSVAVAAPAAATKPPLDRTFGGGDGILTVAVTPRAGEDGEAMVAVLPGPGTAFRTVTAGYYPDDGAGDASGFVTVRRFRVPGTLDPAFNRGRPRVLPIIGYSQGPNVSLMGAQTDAAGATYLLTRMTDSGMVASVRGHRVTAAGADDSGYAFTVPAPPAALPGAGESYPPLGEDASMVVRPDGRMRVCMGRWDPQARDYLVGYGSDGSVDGAFGTGEAPGWALLPAAFDDCGTMAVDAEGRLLMADGGAVWRLTPTGAVDAAYGAAGRAPLAFAGWSLTVHRLVVAADGSAYAGGSAVRAGDAWQNGLPFVARLTAAGALDGGFGTGGVQVLDLPHRELTGLTAAGSVYVALSVDIKWVTASVRNAVLRLSPSTGATDVAWGTVPLPSHHQYSSGPVSVALSASGRRVLLPYTASRTPTRNGAYVQARVA